VGRASELASIRQLLASSRLLTLTGPGGAGKTRLALAAAATEATEACWVELAPIDDPGILPSAVAARLEAPERELPELSADPGHRA
jgi:predicted ATPase